MAGRFHVAGSASTESAYVRGGAPIQLWLPTFPPLALSRRRTASLPR